MLTRVTETLTTPPHRWGFEINPKKEQCQYKNHASSLIHWLIGEDWSLQKILYGFPNSVHASNCRQAHLVAMAASTAWDSWGEPHRSCGWLCGSPASLSSCYHGSLYTWFFHTVTATCTMHRSIVRDGNGKFPAWKYTHVPTLSNCNGKIIHTSNHICNFHILHQHIRIYILIHMTKA